MAAFSVYLNPFRDFWEAGWTRKNWLSYADVRSLFGCEYPHTFIAVGPDASYSVPPAGEHFFWGLP